MIPIYVTLSLVLAALSIWAQRELRQFLSAHRDMNDSSAFEDFKGLARRNMYGALVYAGLGLASLLVGIAIVVRHGLPGLGLVLASNVALLLMGQVTKKLEVAVRNLPCAHAPLAEEYRRVSETWVRKPLPNF
jgi:hypothetical protein